MISDRASEEIEKSMMRYKRKLDRAEATVARNARRAAYPKAKPAPKPAQPPKKKYARKPLTPRKKAFANMRRREWYNKNKERLNAARRARYVSKRKPKQG